MVISLSESKVDGDFELRFADNVTKDFGIGLALQTAFAGDFALVINVDEFFSDTGSGVADRVNDTPPIGVFAIPRRFDERGICDGSGGLLGIRGIASTFNFEGDELGDALAISHDGFGKSVHDEGEGVGKVLAVFAPAPDFFVSGCAVGEQDDGVIGRGIAVDRDTIESILDSSLNRFFEAAFTNVGIGRDVAKHRRHVGVNHAGSFSAAADTNALTLELERDGEFLFVSVTGDDGASDVVTLLRGEIVDELLILWFDPHHGHGKSDDARGADCDFPLSQVEKASRVFGHVLGVLHSGWASAGVGVTAISDNRPDPSGAEVALADADWGGFDPVLGEHSSTEAFVFGIDE